MRRPAIVSALALVAFAAAGPAAAQVARRFPLAGFRQVALDSADHVVVRVGTGFSVVADGPAATLATLTAEVRGDTLRIGRRGPPVRTGPATVTVTLPALTGASVAGSGDLTAGPFRAARFTGAVAGSGDLHLQRVVAEQVELSVGGSGDIVAAGRVGRAALSVAGSGDLDAGALEAATLSASVAGSGDLVARATGTARASVAGSGDIVVRGPARCTVSRAGSGDVRCNAG